MRAQSEHVQRVDMARIRGQNPPLHSLRLAQPSGLLELEGRLICLLDGHGLDWLRAFASAAVSLPLSNDPRRIAGDHRIGRDILNHHGAGPDGRAVANSNRSEDHGVGAHIYAVTQHRAGAFRAVAERLAADGGGLAKDAIATYDCAFVNDQGLCVIEAKPGTDFRFVAELDAEEPFDGEPIPG